MLTVIYKPIGDLIPYARNSRTHSEAQVAQIAASIKEFGFTNPVLIDEEGGIIAGHGRVLAARKLSMDEVPTITLEGLTKTQRQAYVIADNKLALNAGWDEELLKVELEELQGDGFDIELLGFDADELSDLQDEEPQQNEGTGAGSLAGKFLVPPFSVLNAREGWWQDRKRAWIALGIKSELGRGGGLTLSSKETTTENLNFYRNRQRPAAAPGGSARPACDYSKKQRGDGTGKPING